MTSLPNATKAEQMNLNVEETTAMMSSIFSTSCEMSRNPNERSVCDNVDIRMAFRPYGCGRAPREMAGVEEDMHSCGETDLQMMLEFERFRTL